MGFKKADSHQGIPLEEAYYGWPRLEVIKTTVGDKTNIRLYKFGSKVLKEENPERQLDKVDFQLDGRVTNPDEFYPLIKTMFPVDYDPQKDDEGNIIENPPFLGAIDDL